MYGNVFSKMLKNDVNFSEKSVFSGVPRFGGRIMFCVSGISNYVLRTIFMGCKFTGNVKLCNSNLRNPGRDY